MVLTPQAKLLHVIDALGSTCPFARVLNEWQQNREYDDEQGNHDDQFDFRETTLSRFVSHKIHSPFSGFHYPPYRITSR